jgi:catechol 2,3-dioxygenase-like lactoylglutathione lyase family enzyme
MKRTAIVGLDHLSIPVRRVAAARRFYVKALGALGMRVNMDFDNSFGMGSKAQKVVWIVKDPKASGDVHLALRVDHREEVDAFHRAALAAGGTDNGEPGVRKSYGPNYYAAFVHDPEGNNIEVVCYAKTKARRVDRRAGATAHQAH